MAAGVAAGAINAVVGSGSLITFPTLLALGYSPVVANVSNTVGLVPGAVSGAYGYRRELTGQASRARSLGVASGAGGLVGGILLLVVPGTVFRRVVPVLILLACLLIAIQPRVSARLAAREANSRKHGGPWLHLGVFGTGIYGGYFGAAQGVILIALLGIFLNEGLQRVNALKNVLAGVVNGVAACLFIVFAHVAWGAALLLGLGAIAGGQLGSRFGRRIPELALRTAVVVVGMVVGVKLLL
jgi:uncharacterized protein